MLFSPHSPIFNSFYRVWSRLYHFVYIVLCKTQRLEAMASGEVGREQNCSQKLANRSSSNVVTIRIHVYSTLPTCKIAPPFFSMRK